MWYIHYLLAQRKTNLLPQNAHIFCLFIHLKIFCFRFLLLFLYFFVHSARMFVWLCVCLHGMIWEYLTGIGRVNSAGWDGGGVGLKRGKMCRVLIEKIGKNKFFSNDLWRPTSSTLILFHLPKNNPKMWDKCLLWFMINNHWFQYP